MPSPCPILSPVRTRALFVALSGALLLAACGSTAAEDMGEAAGPEPTEDGFPLTVESCGTETTLEAPPERIVTFKSTATELVLSLGAGDRLVGAAHLDAPVPEHLQDAAAGLEVLSEGGPPEWETVLSVEPELVYAGWESGLTPEGAGAREDYEELGVSTFVPPSACEAAEHRPVPLTFEDVFDEIELAGRMLGEEEAAEELIAEQRAALEAVEPAGEGLRAIWYSSGTDQPYVGAAQSAPNMIMEAIGLENVITEPDRWVSIEWEAFAEADPDVIVLVDADWNTAEGKIEELTSHPVASELDAVQEERFLVVDFPATEPGVRNVSAVEDLAAQLAELEVSR